MSTQTARAPAARSAFYRELFSLAVPIGLQNLLTALVGATDALMLGRFSQDAVSAVSLANQTAFVMSLFSGALVGGGGVLLAQYWGRNDRRMVKNLFCTLLKGSAGLSAVFFALALFAPDRLMRIYTPDPGLVEIGASYLRAVSFSYLCSGVTACYYLMMKLEGKARRSVLISVVTLGADMALDWFLIYGRAGVPRLGAAGSAYSTVAVELLSLVWCVAESHRPGGVRPDRAGFRWFSRALARDLAKISLPMLGSSLAWGLGFSAHSVLMGHLGSDATAAASIAAIAQELVTCLSKGVSAGAGIMIGRLLGQNLLAQARAYGRAFSRLSIWVGGVHTALLCLIAPAVTAFFVLSDTARHYLGLMLAFSALYVFAYSVNTIVVCGIFPAGGDTGYDAVSVFLASWCFALPLALAGAFIWHWPVMLVYSAMCADEIVKLPFILPRYKKYLWVKNLTRESERPAAAH